jgi:hypothetical protein
MAKAGRRVRIIAAICLTVLLAAVFALSPYIDAYKANRHLSIAGVRLLMTRGQVEEILGEGSPIGGFGASFYEYGDSAVRVGYKWDGMLKGKASWITISDPKHSIYGIKAGDSFEAAEAILKKHGFVYDRTEDAFRRGSVRVSINWDSVRITIEDWTTKGRVY